MVIMNLKLCLKKVFRKMEQVLTKIEQCLFKVCNVFI